MRTSCPKCKCSFDIPHRTVLKEAERLNEKRGGVSVVRPPDDLPDDIGNRSTPKPNTRRITLELDELDYDVIRNYIADFQEVSRRIAPGEPTILPDGDSNLFGAIMAECVRDLLEYRELHEE